MVDIGGVHISNMEYGFILESKRVTSAMFKIFIPKLTPKLDSGKISIKNINPDKDLILNPNFKVSGYKTQNFLEAENITSITLKHKGNVTKMSKSDGISEIETKKKMPIKLVHKKGPPHPPHEHVIKKPFTFDDMVYEDLHREKVSKGDKVIVSFVGDNIYDPKIIYIPKSVVRGD